MIKNKLNLTGVLCIVLLAACGKKNRSSESVSFGSGSKYVTVEETFSTDKATKSAPASPIVTPIAVPHFPEKGSPSPKNNRVRDLLPGSPVHTIDLTPPTPRNNIDFTAKKK